ncbi:MAG: hypothetical protein H3C47_00855 [Candidatus Cloacimonetes bacterium]|nr:hypothetical protein [Candidatus Cloacimonadota bacterium]
MQTIVILLVLGYSQFNVVKTLDISQDPTHYLPGVILGILISTTFWLLNQKYKVPLFIPLLLLIQEPMLPHGTYFCLLNLFLFFSQRSFNLDINQSYKDLSGINRFGIPLYLQCLVKSHHFFIQATILILAALLMSPSMDLSLQLILACILVWR